MQMFANKNFIFDKIPTRFSIKIEMSKYLYVIMPCKESDKKIKYKKSTHTISLLTGFISKLISGRQDIFTNDSQ